MTGDAIAVTRPDAAPNTGVQVEKLTDVLALVVLPKRTALSARDRLHRCVTFHARFPAMIPFTPRAPIDVAVARTHVMQNHDALEAQVQSAARIVEFHVRVDIATSPETMPVSAATGRDWLEVRRARAARQRATSAEIEAWGLQVFGGLGADCVALQHHAHHVGLVLQVPLAVAGTVAHHARQAGASDVIPSGAKGPIIVSGPWPLFSLAEKGTAQ